MGQDLAWARKFNFVQIKSLGSQRARTILKNKCILRKYVVMYTIDRSIWVGN